MGQAGAVTSGKLTMSSLEDPVASSERMWLPAGVTQGHTNQGPSDTGTPCCAQALAQMLHILQVTAGNCTASHCHTLPVNKDSAPTADIHAAAASWHHESIAHTLHSLDTTRTLHSPV